MIVYNTRPNAFNPTNEWHLTENALVKFVNNTAQLTIPYGDIKSVRLYYSPYRYRAYNYECEIITIFHQKLKIQSTSYHSFAVFDNQAQTYIPFVKSFIENLGLKNKSAIAFTGLSKKKFFTYLIVSSIIIGFTYILLNSFTNPLLAGLLVFGYIFYTVQYFKRNWPKNIVDNEIPDKVLPSI